MATVSVQTLSLSKLKAAKYVSEQYNNEVLSCNPNGKYDCVYIAS